MQIQFSLHCFIRYRELNRLTFSLFILGLLYNKSKIDQKQYIQDHSANYKSKADVLLTHNHDWWTGALHMGYCNKYYRHQCILIIWHKTSTTNQLYLVLIRKIRKFKMRRYFQNVYFIQTPIRRHQYTPHPKSSVLFFQYSKTFPFFEKSTRFNLLLQRYQRLNEAKYCLWYEYMIEHSRWG